MPKRTDLLDKNPLTCEEAGDLAELITDLDSADAARLLLLCHGFTYEGDESKREGMLREMEARLGPFLPGFDDMQRADMLAALKEIRKGDDAR
jgi:hypothetical protein